MPAPIKTADELRNYLSKGEVSLLERSPDLSGYSQDVQYLVGKVKARALAKGEDIEIHPEDIIAQQQEYLQKKQEDLQRSAKQEDGSGDIARSLLEFGGALATPVLNGEDRQSRVIREFNDKQREDKTEEFKTLLKSLPEDFSNLSEADTQTLKTALSRLQTDALLEDNLGEFKTRLQQVGQTTNIDTTAISESMKENHDTFLKEKMERAKKKGKEYKDPTLFDADKVIESLKKAKTPEERLSILRGLHAHQQGLTARSLDQILTARKANFLGFGQKSLISKKLGKGFFTLRKAEVTARKKRILEERKASRNTQSPVQRIERIVPVVQQFESGDSSFDDGSSDSDEDVSGGFSPVDTANNIYNNVQNIRSSVNNIKKIVDLFNKGGKVAEGAEAVGGAGGVLSSIFGFLGATAEVWVPALIIILLIILLIVLIVSGVIPTTSDSNKQNILSIQQVKCDENSFQIVNGNNNYASLLKTYMGITPGPYLLQDQYKDVVKSIFENTCVLFGYQQDTLLTKGNLNTFGTLTVGTLTQRAMNPGKPPTSNGSSTITLRVSIDAGTDNTNSCYMVKERGLFDWKNSKTIKWTLMNPSLCSPNKLTFILAQTYAYTMLEQQQFLKSVKGEKPQDMLQKFKTEPKESPGVIKADGLLPTITCQQGNINVKDLNNPDSQQVNCFVDMVGAYASYPIYFDGDSQAASSLVPTPTGITPPKGADAINFGSFKTSYPNYYQFAYTNLFNNKDLFNLPTPPSGVVSCNDPLTASLPDDTKAIILKKYGFRVAVDKGLNEEDQLAQTYNTLCLLFQSSTFVKLLGTINPDGSVADAMTLIIHKSPDFQKRCGTGNDFNSNQPEIYACARPDANRFVLTHELGHTVYARNIQLSVQYDNLFTGAQKFPDGKNNNSQRFLPTGNCQNAGKPGFGSNVDHECFADMVSEYVVFSTYKHWVTNDHPEVTFSEFATDPQYKDWYEWVGKNVFGGTSYDNQSSSAIVAYAKMLKDQIVQACPPVHNDHGWEVGGYVFVNQRNQNCLTNMSSQVLGPHKQNVLNELFSSISNFYYLQCVGFARAVAQGAGAPIGASDRASSQYYTWIPVTLGLHNVPGGVMAGDIALFSLHECAFNVPYDKCPRAGRFIVPHIGIVIDVGPTGFDLAEANGGNGTVDITKGYNYHYDSNFDGVLRLKKSLP